MYDWEILMQHESAIQGELCLQDIKNLQSLKEELIEKFISLFLKNLSK